MTRQLSDLSFRRLPFAPIYAADYAHRAGLSRTIPLSMARQDARETFPYPLLFCIYAVITAFYAAGIYDGELSKKITLIKWLSLVPLIILLFWYRRNMRNLTGSAFLFVALLCAISASVLTSLNVSLSAATLVSVAFVLIAGYLLAEHLANTNCQRQFFVIFANVGRVVIVSSAIMWALGINLGRAAPRFSGWTDNPNTLGPEIAPCLIIMIAGVFQGRRSSFFWNAPFIAVGAFVLLQTESRASILWVLASTATFVVIKFGFFRSTVMAIFASCIWVGWGDEIRNQSLALLNRNPDPFAANDLLSGRSEVWALAYDLIPQSPFLGFGLGSSKLLTESYQWVFIEHQGEHFHNSYLTVLVETGIVGFFALLAILTTAFLRGAQRAHRDKLRPDWATASLPFVMLSGALFHAMFETWLLSAGNVNSLLLWVCLALLCARAPSMARQVRR